VKSSKSETQHDIHKIYSHFIKTLSSKSHTQDEVYEKKGELSDHLFENVTFFGKDFSFCGKFCEIKQVGDPVSNLQNLLALY